MDEPAHDRRRPISLPLSSFLSITITVPQYILLPAPQDVAYLPPSITFSGDFRRLLSTDSGHQCGAFHCWWVPGWEQFERFGNGVCSSQVQDGEDLIRLGAGEGDVAYADANCMCYWTSTWTSPWGLCRKRKSLDYQTGCGGNNAQSCRIWQGTEDDGASDSASDDLSECRRNVTSPDLDEPVKVGASVA